MRRRLVRTSALVATAAALAFAPMPPTVIDRWYSTGVFAAIQPTLTSWTSVPTVAVFDVLLGCVALAVVGALAVCLGAPRGRRTRTVGRVALIGVGMTAGVYIWFALVWGLNYRRSPIETGLVRGARPQAVDVMRLGRRTVESLNALYRDAHAAGWADEEWRQPDLRRAFGATLSLLGHERPVEPGRLKRTLLGPYFRWSGVDGMISPFTLEVLANPDLLPLERPFVAAHEWAHLAGYADEAEASFVGFLTCVRGGPPEQYSGWMFLLWQVRAEVDASQRAVLDRAMGAGPRADLAAVAERVQRGAQPQLRRASWAAYDRYLRANRVQEGVRSYGRVVTLLTTVRFTEPWIPVRVGATPVNR
jgi:hypothetical protein